MDSIDYSSLSIPEEETKKGQIDPSLLQQEGMPLPSSIMDDEESSQVVNEGYRTMMEEFKELQVTLSHLL